MTKDKRQYLPTDLRVKREADERGTNHPNELTDDELAKAVEQLKLDRAAEEPELSPPPYPDDSQPSFAGWWLGMVELLAPAIQEKARQYGTNSLVEVGRLYARAQGRDPIGQVEAIEIGCMMYAYGKMQRVVDAMQRGELPSTDTWHDLMVYSAMAQFARAHGRWP